jgi:hypothetical protein
MVRATREACPVNLKTLLTSILLDGKQARIVAKDIGDKVADVDVKVDGVGDKVQCVDDKVQVVINGAHGLSGWFFKPFPHVYFQTGDKQE